MPRVAAGEEIGGLLGIRLTDVSGTNALAGAGANVDGDIDEVRLRALLLGGNRGGGNSGKLGDPDGTDALIPEYCNCCCMEGGIGNPGGG